jgi:hypothetical protein
MYIASNDSRLYAALEAQYGQVPAIGAANRFPAGTLRVTQALEKIRRRDKTGTRTFLGLPTGMRKQTTFELKTPMTGLPESEAQPGYGPLFEAATGGSPLSYAGGTVAAALSAWRIQFAGAHGLAAGQAIAIGGEIRFVAAVVNSVTVDVNAPFAEAPAAGSIATRAITYVLGEDLPSASIFDCWSPAEAAQRLVTGAAVNEMMVAINGDWHEFRFRGAARDVIDNLSFEQGQGGLDQFPEEPALNGFEYTVVPGHMGQVWMGAGPDRFFTLTGAEVKLNNGVELRSREFGLDGPQMVVAGERKVTVAMELFASDDAETHALYQAARQRSPIQMMFQLGQQPGQLFGMYMKSVVPEVPDFDDSETRLSWKFAASRAQGSGDDELVIAFA